MIKRGYINVFGSHAAMLMVALLLNMGTLTAQMSVAIGEQLHCENSSVSVPMNVSGFNDVAAFTLYISLDTLKAEYVEILNPNAQLSGGFVIANFAEVTSTLIITWQSMSAANIPSGKLLDIVMDYHGDLAELKFLGNCEIALSDLTVVTNVTYVDGLLIPAIDITLQPQSISVTEGETAEFMIELQALGDQTFIWQQNNGSGWSDLAETPPFSGVNSPSLTISDVPYSFNNHSFRCTITFNDCEEVSEPAVLTVSPLTVVNNNSSAKLGITVFPNPATDILHYKILGMSDISSIQLLNLLGEVIDEQQTLNPSGNINLDNFEPGIYFLQAIRNNGTLETVKVLKH